MAPPEETDHALRVDLLSLPHAERRFVVVQRDDVVLAHRRRPPDQPDGSGSSWERARTAWMPAAKKAFLTTARFSLGMAPTAALITGGVAVMRALASQQPGMPRTLLPISWAEAGALTLPLGHPVFDTVYVAHPAPPHKIYYPLAHFHRLTFEHKFAEALRLVTSLGASQVRVFAAQGWDREFAAGLQVSDVFQAAQVGVHTEMESGRRREILYSATLTGHTTPQLPNRMVWYPHEEAWREMTRQRLEHGLRSFEFTVAYHDDYAVTTELAAGLQGVGLQLGGEFKQHESTIWVVAGEFATRLERGDHRAP